MHTVATRCAFFDDDDDDDDDEDDHDDRADRAEHDDEAKLLF